MTIEFKDRVAIVTGAGGGLGRQHALALAARGAKVLVNDLSAAEAVVAEILAAGGEAVANNASVTDSVAVQAMVQQAMDAWGRVDILVNNAGILRDKSFAKMEIEDFELVLNVHLMGAVHCCKAVWPIMNAQKYGRIIMTTSSSGLYGKLWPVQLRRGQDGAGGLDANLVHRRRQERHRVNCLAPTAATQMTQGLMPEAASAALQPEAVVPALPVLASADAPNRTILCAGAGTFEAAHITLTEGCGWAWAMTCLSNWRSAWTR